MKKRIMVLSFFLALLFIVSMVDKSITGFVINDVTGEFPGISMLIAIIIGFVGFTMIKGMRAADKSYQ